jgi:hypothetical protein
MLLRKTKMTKIAELKEFVTDQAHEDAVLTSSERRYQEELVADVLGQEGLSPKLFKELVNLYQTEKQAA